MFNICHFCFYTQTEPAKVCSKLGLCVFDGSHSVGLVKINSIASVDRSGMFLFHFSSNFSSLFLWLRYRNAIESVVEMTKEKGSDLLCTACEMAVVWMENQLRENATKDRILAYANQVLFFIVFLLSGLILHCLCSAACCSLVAKKLWKLFSHFYPLWNLKLSIPCKLGTTL